MSWAGVRCLARVVMHKPGLKLRDINGNLISAAAKTSIVSFSCPAHVLSGCCHCL